MGWLHGRKLGLQKALVLESGPASVAAGRIDGRTKEEEEEFEARHGLHSNSIPPADRPNAYVQVIGLGERHVGSNDSDAADRENHERDPRALKLYARQREAKGTVTYSE